MAVNVVEHDMNTTALGDLQGEVSFPESKVMYFNCDEKIADKLLLLQINLRIQEPKRNDCKRRYIYFGA